MKIELLFVDDCPNHEALLPRLRRLLLRAGIADEVEPRRVASDEEAQRLRFLGSPTIRVEGRDVEPQAEQRQDYGLKCRLYRGPEGVAGMPADAWILAVLATNGSEILTGRPLRDRLEGAPAPYRELHHRVLRSFLAGRRPTVAELDRQADEIDIGLDGALADLQRRDVLWLDSARRAVQVAYPFSGSPTAYAVQLAGSPARLFAMCAIDALGVPFLAGRPGTVRSLDPIGGDAIEVRVDPAGTCEWSPRGAVVVAGHVGDGPSADCCCPHVRFASSRERGEEMLARTPEGPVEILAIPAAADLGRRIFGSLLDDESSAREESI